MAHGGGDADRLVVDATDAIDVRGHRSRYRLRYVWLTEPERLSQRQALRLAAACNAGLGPVIRTALEESKTEQAEAQWRLIEPILLESERLPADGSLPLTINLGQTTLRLGIVVRSRRLDRANRLRLGLEFLPGQQSAQARLALALFNAQIVPDLVEQQPHAA